MKQVYLKIYGRVQGVFFRNSAQEKASQLNITGWVRNVSDETVEITAQGSKEDLQKLIDWCYNGPRLAEVDKIEVKWQLVEDKFENFEIRY